MSLPLHSSRTQQGKQFLASFFVNSQAGRAVLDLGGQAFLFASGTSLNATNLSVVNGRAAPDLPFYQAFTTLRSSLASDPVRFVPAGCLSVAPVAFNVTKVPSVALSDVSFEGCSSVVGPSGERQSDLKGRGGGKVWGG